MRNFGKFVTVAITAVLLEGVVTTTCVNCSVNGAQKKAAKKVVVFKDGKAITEAEINEGIQELPEEMSNRMTMGQLRLLETLLLAYREVTERVAKGTKLNNEDEGQVKRRIDNIAANEYIRRMVATRMTPAALEKHYDKTYKEKIEGQKAADVRIIILKNKSEIEAFDPVVKANGSAAAVEAYCAKHPANVAATLKNRLLATLPPEVAKIASTKGGKHLVGPFKVRGVMMYFYVDDVCDARKEKFTEALARAYSRGAELDFTRDFYAELFKQYDAKVCGLDKKDFNPNDFKPEVLGKNATDKSEAAVLKLGDAHVLAKYKGGIVTAKDVKEYYTTPSLGSDVLIGMRSRYGMSLWDVIVYAVRVILEERIAALECKKAKFDQEPEIMRIIARERNDETLHVVLSKLKVDEKAVQRAFEDLMKTVDRDDH
ncbi:MAG: peptidyl-prolyl cis-trans isomerase [Holosporales bacterium]|jgi:hypothetical protein|nr:peptidyl-prolyl cis-trans isomerase [Holosporales bacterium]